MANLIVTFVKFYVTSSKKFSFKLYKTTYYEYKILKDAQTFRKIKEELIFCSFF